MICPVCHQNHNHLIHRFDAGYDQPALEALEAEIPGWKPDQGVCSRCLDQAQIGLAGQWKTFGEFRGYQILPIPVRLTAHPGYTGKGVTICMIDSGFYPHPDLTQPQNRILAVVDPEKPNENSLKNQNNSWHGTMTSVVCAGNGFLSGGKYKGLAPDARLVLLKVSDAQGAISGPAIARAVRWAVENRKKYGIRILNLSVSDDWSTSYRENEVDQAIRQAVEAGIVVVAAAGNQAGGELKAPANSPHAITVGGLDDRNTLHPLVYSLYHSNFGQTVDGLHKPELIAPAIWIPAPILPETPEYRQAAVLLDLAQTDDDRYLKAKLANLLDQTGLGKRLADETPAVIRQTINREIENRKLISPHYQHADGTSFAAPIVSGVIAQMLEANPGLTPAGVREILLNTARKLENEPVERQGYGVVHPLSAVYAAEKSHLGLPADFTPLVDYKNQTVEWRLAQEAAKKVGVAGDFSRWGTNRLQLEEKGEGRWSGQFRLLPPGRYRYKFVINDTQWIPDPTNLFREPDGFGGFNSQLIVER